MMSTSKTAPEKRPLVVHCPGTPSPPEEQYIPLCATRPIAEGSGGDTRCFSLGHEHQHEQGLQALNDSGGDDDKPKILPAPAPTPAPTPTLAPAPASASAPTPELTGSTTTTVSSADSSGLCDFGPIPSNSNANTGEGMIGSNNNNYEPLSSAAQQRGQAERGVPPHALKRDPSSLPGGERIPLLKQNQGRHGASKGVDANRSVSDSACPLFGAGAAAEGHQQVPERGLNRHRATSSSDANSLFLWANDLLQGGGSGNNSKTAMAAPCTPCPSTAGSVTGRSGASGQSFHGYGLPIARDGIAMSTTEIAAAGSVVQKHEAVPQRHMSTLLLTHEHGGAGSRPESCRASATFLVGGHEEESDVPLFQLRAAAREELHRLHQLQPHRKQQPIQTQHQAHAMMLNTVRAMGPALSQGWVHNPRTTNNDRIRSIGEDNPRPTNKKRKQNRTPYRCKRCGQLKNKHDCPLRHSPVETVGSQTTKLPPGTVFGAPDLPVPSPNGDNVFYPRPYRACLNNHDEETGPYLNRYSPGLPSSHLCEESAIMRRRTGVFDPLGQDDCGVYGGGGARSGSRSVPSNKQEPLHGHPSGCSCSGAANTGLEPLPSTYTGDLTGEKWPSSSDFPRSPPSDGDCPRSRGGKVEGDLESSFHPLSSPALSMAPPPMMTPSPGVKSADCWRRDNVNTNNGLTPRLENLERMLFGEGFAKGLLDGRNPVSRDCTGHREGASKPAYNCSGNNDNGSASCLSPSQVDPATNSTIQTPQPAGGLGAPETGAAGGSPCPGADDAPGSKKGVSADRAGTNEFSV